MLSKANVALADAYVNALIGRGYRAVIRNYPGLIAYKVYKNAFPTHDTAGETRQRVARAVGREPDRYIECGKEHFYIWDLSATRRINVGHQRGTGAYLELVDGGSKIIPESACHP